MTYRLRTKAALSAFLSLPFAAPSAWADYSITVLHNNDGESKLLNYGSGALSEYGGVARFATMLNQTRDFYESRNHGVVSVFAGDTFLAGAQFQASLDSGTPGNRTFYDALAISRMGYDVSVIGNHEFDFGPDVLAEFISDAQTHNPTTYLSANLGFAGEAALQAHVDAGRIAPTKTISVSTAAGTKTVGIIGATTTDLPFVSSPGAVAVGAVASAVNTQVANLKAAGVDHIILAGHLQGLASDNALVSSLDGGIDLIIAGGGDELLRNPAADSPSAVYGPTAPGSVKDTGFIPGETPPATLAGGLTNNYPLPSTTTDADGNSIPIVTTGGNYGYLGRVTLDFDAAGNLLGIDNSSGPQRVASPAADATHGVAPDADVTNEVVTPVQNFVDSLASNKLAETSVQLLHGGSNTIRSRETNLGDFVADAFLHAAQERAAEFGVDSPMISMINGGGIRANINVGNVTQLDTFNVSPFGNFVSVVEDVKLADLKLLLENAYSRTSDSDLTDGVQPVGGDGRFAQIAGMTVEYDIAQPGFAFDANGNVTRAGNRILDIIIGGTPFLINGDWLVDPDTATIDMALLAFSASGGDQWFRTAIGGNTTYLSQLYTWTTLGLTDQNALQEYIEFIAGGNTTTDLSRFKPEYGVTQSFAGGRITAVPEPASAMLLGLFGVATARRRRCR